MIIRIVLISSSAPLQQEDLRRHAIRALCLGALKILDWLFLRGLQWDPAIFTEVSQDPSWSPDSFGGVSAVILELNRRRLGFNWRDLFELSYEADLTSIKTLVGHGLVITEEFACHALERRYELVLKEF